MDVPAITEKVKKWWDVWNLRTCILISLSLQVILLLFASFCRQRFRNSLILSFIWVAYLLADWIAAVAIGLVTQSEGEAESCVCSISKREFDQDIYALWASFLLLHLGGPDTITSFSLEDNELWIRHSFGLILQGLAAAYSFYLAFPKNKLLFPTILVFVAGIIKYAERTYALYLASLDHFGRTALPMPEPGLDYEEASTIYFSNLRKVPIQEEMMAGKPNSRTTGSTSRDLYSELYRITTNTKVSAEIKQLRAAHVLFKRFKALIVGFLLTSEDRKSSRDYFMNLTEHKWAFRLIEYELSFMFQVLHTKVVVLHDKKWTYYPRVLSFVLVLVATILFILAEKHGFGRFEIILTYALLTGANALEIISFIIMIFFSDWTLVLKDKWRKCVPSCFLNRQRWSRSVSQYNMISYCLDRRPTRFCCKQARKFLNYMKIMWFPASYEVNDDLQELVFKDLKLKSTEASNLREECLRRGDLALMQSTTDDVASYLKLKWSIGDFQYADSLLLWHIATEICCLEEKREEKRDEKKDKKRNCKILSDYMFYLLIARPTMFSQVLGDWHVLFQDTYAEAKRFVKKYKISDPSEALDKIKSTKVKFRAAEVKGTKSKSVFFDAFILAEQLRNLENDKWEIMDRVWVEFMSYAAINCRPIVHAQQPSKGGELLTFTWLLMNHLGLGTQFSEQEEQPGMKMAAVK